MEPSNQIDRVTETRMVKVVQHHAYRSRPEREYFYIQSSRPAIDNSPGVAA
jgi:hypothetical protein